MIVPRLEEPGANIQMGLCVDMPLLAVENVGRACVSSRGNDHAVDHDVGGVGVHRPFAE